MAHRLRLWLAGIALAIPLAVAIPTVTPTPAQAYSCSGGRDISVSGPVSEVRGTFYPKCSDGLAHWNGVIRDIACDSRKAAVDLLADYYPPEYVTWVHGYTASNGCGTEANFSGQDRGLPVFSSAWTLHIVTKACNFWSCSSPTTRVISSG